MRRLGGCLIFILIFAEGADAAFPDIGLGARPMGMGGAFVALADDANSVFWNPAGLSQLQPFEFSSMYLSLYGLDVNSQLISGTFRPSFASGFGVGVLRTGEAGLYTEESWILAMGQDLYPLIKTHLSIGGSLKRLHKGYGDVDKGDPLFAGGTGVSQLSSDVGFLWHLWHDTLRLGGLVENLVPTSASLDKTDRDNRISPVLRVGIAYQPTRRLTLAAERVQRRFNGPFVQRSRRLGLEWRPVGALAGQGSAFIVRAGMRLAERQENAAYFGGGLQFGVGTILTVDYAFSLPVTGDSASLGNTHRFSFSVAFGGSEIDNAAPTLTEPTANPTTIKNGQTLTLTVKSKSGVSVWADILELDTTQLKPVTFVEHETEPGTYSASIVISKDNTADNGSKTITITATDAAGHRATVAIIVGLYNVSE